MMSRKIYLISIITLAAAAVFLTACGEKRKTPADIKDKVAWLDSRSALPHFPFGSNIIYLFFNAHWCHNSQFMRDSIFSRPEIIEYLNNNFTCISVIPDSIDKVIFLGEEMDQKTLMETFQCENYPSHYFCTPDGKAVGVAEGALELRDFKQLLKFYAEGYFMKMTIDEFSATPEAKMDTVYGEF